MASESGEIIRRLVEGGQNYQTIGQVLGRNRSLVRQVAIGAKPGNNLRDALAQLERRLAGQAVEVAAPVRRTTSRGALARVRRPTTVRGRAWTSSTVKRQGVRSGARSLGHVLADAADAGQMGAATVTFGKRTRVEAYGTSRRGRAGLGGSVDMELGPADEVWSTIHDSYGGDVTAYIMDEVAGRGLVSGEVEIVSIDLRTYTG